MKTPLLPLFLPPFFITPLLGDEKEENALADLKLPGLTLNLEEHSVDVQSIVSLNEGPLEFVACTKDTKEHESILIVQAMPSHIHTALLLLGAKAGHPATRRIEGEGDSQHYVETPPNGSPVVVSFVIPNQDGKTSEHPLADFIIKADGSGTPFTPTSFIFAGSHLTGKTDAPQIYLADKSGSVISISTFGDELLCLPQIYGHENQALQWAVNSKNTPKKGTKVILRLRPEIQKEASQK